MVSPRWHERAAGVSEKAYRFLLRAYPRRLRGEYGDEMARCFKDLSHEELEHRGGLGLTALWARTLPELAYTALKERRAMSNRNVYRSVIVLALATAFLLLLPLLATRLIGEVAWTLSDFVFAGALIFGTGLAYVLVPLVARRAGNNTYKAAVGVALGAVFILVWATGAVGIIGSEDNPANLMYVGVLAVGIIGAVVARLRPPGMARVLFAMALAQASVAVIAMIAVIAGLVDSPLNGLVEILIINGFFVALFVGSGLLFRHAGREQTSAGAGQEG